MIGKDAYVELEPDFHYLWGHLMLPCYKEKTPAGVVMRSKYPEKHSVTLLKNDYFL